MLCYTPQDRSNALSILDLLNTEKIFKLEKKFIEHQFRKNRSEEKSKQIRRSLSIEIENKFEAEMQGINKVKVN